MLTTHALSISRRIVSPSLRTIQCHKFTSDQSQKELKMDYRMLGNTGLKVSLFSFGFFATFGVKEGIDRALSILEICRKNGINFYDNAEVYGKNRGDAEKIMGDAISILKSNNSNDWRRSDIVISSKVFWGGDGQNEKGLSRKHIIEGVNGCLDRLQMDYLDVLFCHRPDQLTPMEEIVDSMTSLIRYDKKALYWGTSEWSTAQIIEAYYIAKLNNLIPPCVEQVQYNMLTRDRFEKEYKKIYEEPYGIGTTVWGPLKSGILSGKYLDEVPDDSRANQYDFIKSQLGNMEQNEIIKNLQKYAKDKFNCSIATLAIAWVAKNKNVSTVLLGASKEHQLEENLKAISVGQQLTKQHMEEIDAILGNKPVDEAHWGRFLDNLIEPL
eukprot:414706_1